MGTLIEVSKFIIDRTNQSAIKKIPFDKLFIGDSYNVNLFISGSKLEDVGECH